MSHSNKILNDDSFIKEALINYKRFDLTKVPVNTPEWRLKVCINNMANDLLKRIGEMWEKNKKWKSNADSFNECLREEECMRYASIRNLRHNIDQLRWKLWYFKNINY